MSHQSASYIRFQDKETKVTIIITAHNIDDHSNINGELVERVQTFSYLGSKHN